MEPMKRITLGVFIILLIGTVALFAIYMSVKKLGEQAGARQAREAAREAAEIQRTESGIGSEKQEEISAPGEKVTAEGVGSVSIPGTEALAEKGKHLAEISGKGMNIISEEELLKYLKVKDEIFPAYNKHRHVSDLMLDQTRKWGPGQVKTHMIILGDMMVRKKRGLRDNDLKESRFNQISCAVLEWVRRTRSIPYESLYKGDESFFNKVSSVSPCAENDTLFDKHKETISKTFMGDFELADY
ncbi:MAG: hypothetical protein AB1756_09945 [Acidobacteriota bacterium]